MLSFKRDELVAALSKLRGLAGNHEWALAHFDVVGYNATVSAHDDGRHPTVTITRTLFSMDNGFTGSFAVKLFPLLTFASAAMESAKVTLVIKEDDHVYVTAGRNKLRIPLYKGVVPTIFEPQEEDRVASLTDSNLIALMSLFSVCDKPGSTNSIPLTEGVYLEVGPGYVRALATDRYKAAYVWRENVETFVEGVVSGVVNAQAADLVIRNSTEDVDVYLNNTRVFFSGLNFVIYATLIPINGGYPAKMLAKALSDEIGAGAVVDSSELTRKVTAVCALSGSSNSPVSFSMVGTSVEMRTSAEVGAGEFHVLGSPIGEGEMNFKINGAYLKAAISMLETIGDDGMLEVSMFLGKTQPWVFFHSEAVAGARYAVARIAD